MPPTWLVDWTTKKYIKIGASGDASKGGVHRRSFGFNTDTGKWGDVQADGSVVWNENGPYKNHPVQGLYRPTN